MELALYGDSSELNNTKERDSIVIATLALAHYLLLSELQAKADEAAQPEPYVIKVGESEYERELKVEAEAKAERLRKEAAKREKSTTESKLRARTTNAKPSDADTNRSWLTFVATAFTAGPESTGKSPGDADYGITASGRHVQQGKTIACPKSIALDTRMEIEGLGVRTCDDRGADITEGRLDVYFENVADAREFGRRTVRARIIEK